MASAERAAGAASERGTDGGPAATLRAWREDGAHRLDPVRFHFLEALARRVAGCEGEARAVLDERLAGLLTQYGDALAKARAGEQGGGRHAAVRRDTGPSHVAPAISEPAARPGGRAAPQKRDAVQRRGPLAGLVEQLARPAPAAGDEAAKGDGPPGAARAPDLRSLGYFRDTWSRLSAERRVAQSLADVPENAGPLNSRRLVHRALASMQALSPDYLHRFVDYVDALLWLEGVQGRGGAPAGK